MFKRKELLDSFSRKVLIQDIKTKIQKIFWPSLCNMFIVRGLDDFIMVEPKIKCEFIPITSNNYNRVREFRDDYRILEYKNKLTQNEIGYFAEHEGKIIGSIWATINKTNSPIIAKTYMRLMPNEALIHDIVTAESFRGMRVASFMVINISSVLLEKYGASRIIIDVNTRNRPSLRMMKSIGLQIDHRMLSVSAFGTLLFNRTMKRAG